MSTEGDNEVLIEFLDFPDIKLYENDRNHIIANFVPRNIYAVQQIHKVFFMTEFYSSRMLARHVSDLTGPSSGGRSETCRANICDE